VVLANPAAPAAVALRDVAAGLTARGRGLLGRQLGLTPAGR
jgi:ATP-binding protein involved in chromosome partitioning